MIISGLTGHWGNNYSVPGGLQPLYEGLEGDGAIEEGVEALKPTKVPSGLYLVVMEWMAAITDDRVGYFGIFLQEKILEKIFGEVSSVWWKRKPPRLCFRRSGYLPVYKQNKRQREPSKFNSHIVMS